MKFQLVVVLWFVSLCESALAGLVKFEEKDAVEAVRISDEIFEAKLVRAEKTLRIAKSGKVVSAKELERIEKPEGEAWKVIGVTITHVAEFEVTKTYKGEFKIGHKFKVTWKDLRGSGCPHLENQMIVGEGLWAHRKGGEKGFRPYPRKMGELMRKALNVKKSDDIKKANTGEKSKRKKQL